MPSFLTQCPHCLTSFRVTNAQLEAADGLVRCGACLGIFSAASNRITLKQTPDEAALASAEADDEWDDELDDDEITEDELDESAEVQPPAAAAAIVTKHTDADLLDQNYDIPLGDFKLDADQDSREHDIDDEFEDELEDDEFEEDELEDEELDDDDPDDNDPDDDADLDDEADTEARSVYEEYQDEDPVVDEAVDATPTYADEFEPGIHFDDDDVTVAEADAALAAYEESRLAEPAPALPNDRITTDKAELRRYLAEIEDDDALGAIGDEALDAFDEPVLLDTAPRRSWFVGFALFVANVLLAGLLLLQYADANINTLSRNARFAPALPFVCRVLECPPPARSQLDQLVSEQLLVRSHPRYAQALEVSLVFRNDAAVSQPFPAIELGFSDTGNRLLANRLFTPAEYLPNELQTSEMPAQSSLQITLELEDPGSEAVNYTLAFREPE